MAERYELRVVQDEYPTSPSEWRDDDLFLVADHRGFAVAAPKGVDLDDENFQVYPLRAYIHSGIALSLGAEGYPFNDGWDSAWIGKVYVRKDAVGDVKEAAEALVDEWNQYLSGDVWGYKIVLIQTCDLGHEHELPVESCWGYYSEADAQTDGAEALSIAQEVSGECYGR